MRPVRNTLKDRKRTKAEKGCPRFVSVAMYDDDDFEFDNVFMESVVQELDRQETQFLQSQDPNGREALTDLTTSRSEARIPDREPFVTIDSPGDDIAALSERQVPSGACNMVFSNENVSILGPNPTIKHAGMGILSFSLAGTLHRTPYFGGTSAASNIARSRGEKISIERTGTLPCRIAI